MSANAHRRPAYERIAETLRRSIEAGTLPEGAVLLEGPLAGLFGFSRAPVKQALVQLEREGRLARFGGRGLVVGRSRRPLRIELTANHLLLEDAPAQAPNPLDAIYYGVERDLLQRSLFGRFRVNELALARHFAIGRMAARDLLLKAQNAGIVAKQERSHWWTVPLNEKRLRDLYQLREVLEPVALQSAAAALPVPVLEGVRDRLDAAASRFPDLSIQELDALEEDLHATCIGYCRNPELVEALHRARASLISGKHMQSILTGEGHADAFLDEHMAVVCALMKGNAEGASRALRDHLVASREKGVHRLAEFHERFSVTAIDYIID